MDNKNTKSIENKAISRRFFQEVCTDGDLEVIKKLVTEDAVHRDRDEEEYHGPEGVRNWISAYCIAFPDLRVVVETQIAEGDWVATPWTTRGTHKGYLWGFPPTGKEFAITGVTFDRFIGGRIAESLESWDAASLLKQLGVKEVRNDS
jgi:steroid delta-isomerase-like uncharacterized protein